MFPRAKKSFGQNFLTDRMTVRHIVEAADVQPGEHIVEIGPGTGILTQALVDAGATLLAVEADRDLIPALEERFGDRIELIQADVLSLEAERFPQTPYKLVANIPYNITSSIIERFLTLPNAPTRLVLMVQREVADRMCAVPPQMSILAVACQIYAKVKKVLNVPRGAFRPVPNVDSAVVRLDVTPRVGNEEAVIGLVKAGFSHPRKQLHSNLASAGWITTEQAKAAFVSLGLDPLCRAQTLTVEQWRQLHTMLSQH